MYSTDKTYHVIISDRATEMLLSNIRFLAQVSETAASNLRIQIIKEIKTLEAMPHRYSWFISEMIPANKYRKLIVEKRYLILYQIKDDTVYVDYILDCRQDYSWLI